MSKDDEQVIPDATVAMTPDDVAAVRKGGYVALPASALKDTHEDHDKIKAPRLLISLHQANMTAVKVKDSLVIFHGEYLEAHRLSHEHDPEHLILERARAVAKSVKGKRKPAKKTKSAR